MLSLLKVRGFDPCFKQLRFPQAAATYTRTAYHVPGYSSKAGIASISVFKTEEADTQ